MYYGACSLLSIAAAAPFDKSLAKNFSTNLVFLQLHHILQVLFIILYK